MAGGVLNSGVLEQGGARSPGFMNNFALVNATTTNAADSIRIDGANGTDLSASNYGWVTLPSATIGQYTPFSITANVTINLTGAHWGFGTFGDRTDHVIYVYAINDAGTLKWGVSINPHLEVAVDGNEFTVATSVTEPEHILVNTLLTASSYCICVGWFKANFDDTGGAAEDLWAVQTGTGDIFTGTRIHYEHELRTVGWENLGCTLSAGTFTITQASGASLSVNEPAFVWLPDKNVDGQLIKYRVTANQAFIDDVGASEIINNLLGSDDGAGSPNGRAWASDCPFYIYAVGNDAQNDIAFMLSRIPHATRSPVAAAIGAPDDAVADADGDFFSFDNLDETLYDENPCLCIGSIRMRKSAAEDWTVQALTDQDGIGLFHEDTEFTYPQGHHGTEASSFIKLNGGTSVPVFTTNTYTYKIKKNGTLRLNMNLASDAGVDGVGAVSFFSALPISSFEFNSDQDAGIVHVNSSVGGNRLVVCRMSDGGTQFYLIETDGTNVQLADFGNGDRTLKIGMTVDIANASTA